MVKHPPFKRLTQVQFLVGGIHIKWYNSTVVSFKNQCITLRTRGFSLNQIVAKTKRSKTSIYFHIKKIPLSEKRHKEILLAAIKRFNDYSKSIKGKCRLDRHPITFTNWNSNLVSLTGHLIFDGEIKKSGCGSGCGHA